MTVEGVTESDAVGEGWNHSKGTVWPSTSLNRGDARDVGQVWRSRLGCEYFKDGDVHQERGRREGKELCVMLLSVGQRHTAKGVNYGPTEN